MKFNKERLNQLRFYENRVSLSFDHNFHRNTAKKLKKKYVYIYFSRIRAVSILNLQSKAENLKTLVSKYQCTTCFHSSSYKLAYL